MSTARQFGGGFVADDMGLGKTLSFLAYIVVERQLSVLWDRVENARAGKTKFHLPEDEQEEGDVCPSPSTPGWIACPCAHSSPTSLMVKKPGLRMACVPSALVRNWWDQWKAHVDTTVTALSMTIIVDHKGAFDHRTTQIDLQSRSDAARLIQRAKAKKFQDNKGQGDDTPLPYQDGYLLLTTTEDYPNWVKTYYTYDGPVIKKGPKDTVGVWTKGKRAQLVFGIAMIDESHEESSRNKGRAKVLLDLPKANEPHIWGYSGTPFSLNPRGLEGVLWAIEGRFV